MDSLVSFRCVRMHVKVMLESSAAVDQFDYQLVLLHTRTSNLEHGKSYLTFLKCSFKKNLQGYFLNKMFFKSSIFIQKRLYIYNACSNFSQWYGNKCFSLFSVVWNQCFSLFSVVWNQEKYFKNMVWYPNQFYLSTKPLNLWFLL